jgi:hypothetical protein
MKYQVFSKPAMVRIVEFTYLLSGDRHSMYFLSKILCMHELSTASRLSVLLLWKCDVTQSHLLYIYRLVGKLTRVIRQ